MTKNFKLSATSFRQQSGIPLLRMLNWAFISKPHNFNEPMPEKKLNETPKNEGGS